MTKKIRLIILLVCALAFFVISPVLVLYSMGYRFDFEKMKITETGGIYVRTFPAADKVIIDSDVTESPGIFSNSIFVQSLLPNLHSVTIEKSGYFTYSKTIPVEEKEVTKLENVLLIKSQTPVLGLFDKVIHFSPAPDSQHAIVISASGTKSFSARYFNFSSPKQPKTVQISQTGRISQVYWSNDSQKALIGFNTLGDLAYYLFDPASAKAALPKLPSLDKYSQQISFHPQDSSQFLFIKNKTLYSAKGAKTVPLIKGVLAYKVLGNNILWLSTEGLLNSSDLSGKLTGPLTDKSVILSGLNVFSLSGKTFIQTNNYFSLLDQNTKKLENVAPVANGYKIVISPDGKNMIYWSGEKIYVYSFENKKYRDIFSGSGIKSCQWLNNDYVIFTARNDIKISEIDYRGNVNIFTLKPKGKNIEVKNPEIFYNGQDGKIYILSNGKLLETERIIP